MGLVKEIIYQESERQENSVCNEIHLWREGTFLRAYDWSAWLACHYLHDFKVNKRQFKDIDEPVAYIGFPESSIGKWLPEGADQTVMGENHLLLRLPDAMLSDTLDNMSDVYASWKDEIVKNESNNSQRHRGGAKDKEASAVEQPATLTNIMQRILAWPIESKSPLDSMAFLADLKQQLAHIL